MFCGAAISDRRARGLPYNQPPTEEPRLPFRFGDCELDVDARRLTCRGREAHLSPKAFEVLALLIESCPRPLSKSTLLDRVWPGACVTDASLTRAINEIRGAIGDQPAEGAIVRTVHRVGYVFAGELASMPAPCGPASPIVCWLIANRHDVGLPDGEHIIGRESGVRVRINSPKVSRHHACITVDGESATLQDLDSKNGVFVRGERLTSPRALRSGDEIRIGPLILHFRIVRPGPSTATDIR